jgi:hypothetical protein
MLEKVSGESGGGLQGDLPVDDASLEDKGVDYDCADHHDYGHHHHDGDHYGGDDGSRDDHQHHGNDYGNDYHSDGGADLSVLGGRGGVECGWISGIIGGIAGRRGCGSRNCRCGFGIYLDDLCV